MRTLTQTLLVALLLPVFAAPASAQRAQPGWIGIALDLPAENRDASVDEHVVIAAVHRGSPAEDAGLLPGDRLLAVGDLQGVDDFRSLPERLRLRVGELVRVRVQREGRRLDLVLRAAERPDDVRSRTLMLRIEPDSLVESMVRAMDSLRVQLAQMREAGDLGPSGRAAVRIVREGARPTGAQAPFEFFVFRGEAHDSLRRAWEELDRVTRELRRDEQRRLGELRRTAGGTDDVEERDPELRSVRSALEEVTRRSAELRSAMSEAARVTAGFDFTRPGAPYPGPGREPAPDVAPDPTPPYSPLTPYLIGSNMVAGAQVVDLNPGLARYFDVEGGVLVVEVTPGTPAALAGIVPGDVITRMDQVVVRTVEDLRLGVSRSGESLPVRLVREGATREVLLSRR